MSTTTENLLKLFGQVSATKQRKGLGWTAAKERPTLR